MPSDHPPSHIHLIVTGGTIDSFFDKRVDSNIPSGESCVRKFLEEQIEPHFTLSQKIVAMKDSRDITDEDRQKIMQEIVNCGHERILITHGTYTIPVTAKFLIDKKTEIAKKIVVITGSFYPLARFADTDAGFNLGFAISSLILSKPGIYVAMNGHLFDGDKVKKDTKQGRLVSIVAV
jgi:L-asparaginase